MYSALFYFPGAFKDENYSDYSDLRDNRPVSNLQFFGEILGKAGGLFRTAPGEGVLGLAGAELEGKAFDLPVHHVQTVT